MMTRLAAATERLENQPTAGNAAQSMASNPGTTVGQYTFSSRCISRMQREKGSEDGKSRAIRKAVHEIFDAEEFASRTPAGEGGRPLLNLAKLTAVHGKARRSYACIFE